MQETVLTYIEEKKFSRLRQILAEMNPADIAIILEEVNENDLPIVLIYGGSQGAQRINQAVMDLIKLYFFYLTIIYIPEKNLFFYYIYKKKKNQLITTINQFFFYNMNIIFLNLPTNI